MKIMKKNNLILLIIVIFFSSITYSQEKPFRIGVKIGFPNGIGGNVEYVTPLLGNKLAISADYSSVNADKYLDPDKGKLSYWEVGLNYYFFKEGRGLYSSVSYGVFDADVTLTEVESEMTFDKYGTANASISNESFNIKLGAKIGKGFYFRPEIGYSLSSFEDAIKVDVNFPDGTSESQYEEIPEEFPKGLMFNIGIGFAF